ncbi:unnamed protein product [Oppiella nova]|uniref:Tetratricopeptide repeat protein 36 n=1 Tax=Oppiella nova TaxID=334625 RepID=A0A7R9MD43_9ACAR|nr:unnamed protein product [Oppiella nova]CAG2174153.1 unnamed protein product [Oppiella nova]
MCSKNDKLVLNSIFNPFLPTTEDNETTGNDVEIIGGPEEELAKQLEIDAINAANCAEYDRSLQLLTEAINAAPNRASWSQLLIGLIYSYNNRAQVYRVKGNTDLAFQDLNNAINLSSGKGLVARQAYCQRGLIHLLNDRQTEGVEDMKVSAKLGNEFARALVVQMNPYAALCNKMLRDMIDKCRNGEEQ